MNDSAERAELQRLKERQALLQADLHALAGQLRKLEERLNQGVGSAPVSADRPTALSPLGAAVGQADSTAQEKLSPAAQPPPIPPVIPNAPGDTGPKLEPPRITFQKELEPVRQATALQSAASATGAGSLEMRVGTYWLVRVGVVMVLTGLVFFGNLAYQNYISQLGPGGKLVLLYLASGLMLAGGWWWQRNAAKESLKNYAQVLFAGGLAAFYFTTYAAHHIEALRVIQSPRVDGLLLLLWAGFMTWIADRKKSEVLAVFAVGLAYYTSIITRVGSFTLYSNLLLTATAVFFLVRNRWTTLSFGSVIASYAAYAFWRFLDTTGWHWASPGEGLWAGTYLLISYWFVFTAAVFLSRSKKFAGVNRACFLTLNNGAFFVMFLFTMMQVQQGGFWRFALVFGSVLLVLAETARRILPSESLAKNSYLTQGLLLVTVGIISNPRFAGLQLALLLAMESVILLLTSQQRSSRVLLGAAVLTAGLAVGWGMDGMRQQEPAGMWLGIGLGALMLVNALSSHRKTAPLPLPARTQPGNAGPVPPNAGAEPSAVAGAGSAPVVSLRAQPAYFSLLALVVWFATTWNNTTSEHFPLILAAEGLALTLSIYSLRIQELSLLSQAYVLIACATWFGTWLERGATPPWWSPLSLLGIGLVLSHWWQRQKTLGMAEPGVKAWQATYALVIVGLAYCWASRGVSAPTWLALTSLLAIVFTAYGVATRAWYLALCGQLFMLVGVVQFAWQLWQGAPGWQFALAPIAAPALLAFGTIRWFKRRPGTDQELRKTLLDTAMVYRWVALAMSVTWVCKYIPEPERVWVLALLGFVIFLCAGWLASAEAMLMAGVFEAVALFLFWMPRGNAAAVYMPDLTAAAVVLLAQQMAKRLPQRYRAQHAVHNVMLLAGGLTVWLFLSRGVLQNASGFYLTASWSMLALAFFTCGIVLRERLYRWLGLGVLACALGRVVFSDVWRLPQVYRIVSFMVLGAVLLVLGFIYSKYQEKIKEWL